MFSVNERRLARLLCSSRLAALLDQRISIVQNLCAFVFTKYQASKLLFLRASPGSKSAADIVFSTLDYGNQNVWSGVSFYLF